MNDDIKNLFEGIDEYVPISKKKKSTYKKLNKRKKDIQFKSTIVKEFFDVETYSDKNLPSSANEALYFDEHYFYGDICEKHPDLNGRRHLSKGECVSCKNEETRLWKKENPERVSFYKEKRKALKIEQYPDWIDEEEFKREYQKKKKEAKRLEKIDGQKRHLDHRVPLNPEQTDIRIPEYRHVWWNIQILTETENLQKGNSVTEELVQEYINNTPKKYRKYIKLISNDGSCN